MIKDILAVLSSNPKSTVAQDYAASVARAFDAHIAGTAIVHDLVIPGTVFDGVAASVLADFRRESEAIAKGAIAKFEDRCRRDGLSAESFMLDARRGMSDVLARAARRFDFTILAQDEPDDDKDNDVMIEAALFNSGRPVIVVPYIHNKALKLDRVLVCWDGSASAARAVADAMPFLKQAKHVEVITVTPDSKASGVPGADIARHLSRHGVKVETGNLVTDNVTIANRILSHAADRGSDFIVMGGYGHSRLREFVLGGVTRDVLASTSVPTLMSH